MSGLPMYTDLTYVNHSLDRHCPRVVIVQRNLAEAPGERAVAWKVIRDCGHLCWHPFRFDWRLAVEVADGFGNRSGRLEASPGDRLIYIRENSGRRRLIREVAAGGDLISVVNRTLGETLTVHLYRGEHLLAVCPLVPRQKRDFRFDRTLFIGTSLRRRQGEAVELTRLMGPPAEVDLSGIRKGRIVMTGGGYGPSALPLCFFIEKEERW